ncbi:MAG: hypothetical protein QM778_29815 [Myxococcales bacterium]
MTKFSSQRSYQPGELAWAERSSADIVRFLERHPVVAQDAHAELVLLESASALWELRPGAPSWAALPIHAIFRRLSIDQAYFPNPALVLAHYEVLHAFVAWLVKQHLIRLSEGDLLADQLMQAKTPLVDDARRLLRARREALERQGAWHEVLKTMGP